jgi:hypothetical protein
VRRAAATAVITKARKKSLTRFQRLNRRLARRPKPVVHIGIGGMFSLLDASVHQREFVISTAQSPWRPARVRFFSRAATWRPARVRFQRAQPAGDRCEFVFNRATAWATSAVRFPSAPPHGDRCEFVFSTAPAPRDQRGFVFKRRRRLATGPSSFFNRATAWRWCEFIFNCATAWRPKRVRF